MISVSGSYIPAINRSSSSPVAANLAICTLGLTTSYLCRRCRLSRWPISEYSSSPSPESGSAAARLSHVSASNDRASDRARTVSTAVPPPPPPPPPPRLATAAGLDDRSSPRGGLGGNGGGDGDRKLPAHLLVDALPDAVTEFRVGVVGVRPADLAQEAAIDGGGG
eukprot:CAMPEP_0181395294 /NCGR_PEP_ID=MMETSP1106-20121128/28258_1 /TAXON_ID=81844 /ORGANISM="Mantoniella antarctica, Strain SL-175" /LENGTH=165 /DNA_ID=CAMNT_0023516895 /DNA_START=205 /DNA_END=699 /DNA_ORIENTATION=-